MLGAPPNHNKQKFFGSFFKKEQNFLLKKEAKTFVN